MDRNRMKLYAFITIPLGVGALSAFLTRNGLSVYKALVHPPLSPPAWLLPVIWTVLYILMGFSSYLAASSPSRRRGEGLWLYGIQLLLNFLRTLVFFQLKNHLLAFFILLFLWYTIVKMISAFWTINRDAAILQIPYLLFITCCGYINLGILFLN